MWSSRLVVLSERRPATVQSVIHHLLPAFICLYATAVLVLLPRTFAIRLAILPVTLWATFRAATILDFSFGYEPYNFWNQSVTVFMFSESLRACVWTFRPEPYTRLTGNKRKSSSIREICFDAFDLLFNLRGIGWSWSHGLYIPKETRNVKSTRHFLFTTIQWLIQGLIVFDFCHYSVQVMLSIRNGSLIGSIFDSSLPPSLRYTRSIIITILTGFTVYLGVENQYNIVTIIAVVIFRQSPSLWPPVSDRPYRATSLNQFWTRGWHQSFRDIFVNCGGKPLASFFGRAGGVMGVFFVSGILHDIGCWSLGRGADPRRISGFFLMNGVGIILEHVYKSLTGKRVGGVVGLIWTYIWVIGWGSLLVDSWFEHGVATSRFWSVEVSPAFYVFTFLFPDAVHGLSDARAF